MKKRIIIICSLIIFIGMIFANFIFYFQYKNTHEAEMEETLLNHNYYINSILNPDDFSDFNENILNEFSVYEKIRISLIEPDGTVIYDSDKNEDELSNHLYREEIQGAFNDVTTFSIRYSTTLKKDMMYVATPFYDSEGSIIGVIRTAIPFEQISSNISNILINIALIMLISFILMIIALTYNLNNYLFKPMEIVQEFASDISHGHYENKLSIIREDEIGDLTISLNEMASALNQSFKDLEEKNNELLSVLSSIKNGVIAINNKKKIIFINDSGKEILNVPFQKDVVNHNVLEIFRDPLIYQIIEELKGGELTNLNYEKKLDDQRILKIYTSPMLTDDKQSINGYIIVIQDITIIRELEEHRRDFIANVSHELKTPITTIRGFIETIQENKIKDEDTLNHFYSIISAESDRLTRLINDILTLSELEKEDAKSFEKRAIINIGNEIVEVIQMLKINAEEKNIEISYDLADSLSTVFDEDQFYQLMINLIQNAIKYTLENGKIFIKAFESNQYICIIVKDTGVGIPQEDIPRLFERFYRVDKGRGRKAGGTGLGLAIVKHILQNHDGTIEVTSEIGKGTEFIIKIPFYLQ
jgi:two-component system phosphate regulon sensor histidine kinase PhoR